MKRLFVVTLASTAKSIQRIPVLFAILLVHQVVLSQTPQFAVVRPNGTTFMCPSWDSAYTKATDGDFIYLPGTTISQSEINLNKQLTIFGAGHYPDSTLTTGRSIFTGTIRITKKVHLEGFECWNSIYVTDNGGNNSTFIRLKFGGLFFSNNSSGHYINGCVLGSIGGDTHCSSFENILVANSIIEGGVRNIKNSSVENCIFLWHSSGNPVYMTSSNTSYKNNIFRGVFGIDWYTSTPCFQLVGNDFYNNVLVNNGIPGNNLGGNVINVDPNSIFVNQTGNIFDYNHNYHLKTNSLYLTAGTNGTQIGVYGGSTPYVEGAVPSNPHIYFKQVAPHTNSNGQLQIQFKVRTGN